MRLTNLSLTTLLLLLLIGCTIISDNEQSLSISGKFAEEGLSNTKISKVAVYDQQLFAATSQGLVSFDISGGLELSDEFMQESNIPTFAIASDENWLISAHVENDTTRSGIYRSTDQGDTWSLYNNGFGGNRQVIPHTMDVENKDPSTIFARPSALTVVARSNNSGQSWETVVQSWENPNFGTSSFIKIDSHHSKRAWAGGATAFFRPRLLLSEDGGATWNGFLVIDNVEAIVYDIVSNPSAKDDILAGLGIIRKSTDGGQSWTTTFNNAAVYTLTHSIRNPETVYASGRNADGTLFFAASGDFGDSWQTVAMPDSPTGIQVNDMVSVSEGGQEVLYLGTNKGLYSYQFEE